LRAGFLALGDAHRKLFEIFYRRLLPTRMLIPVTESYRSREDRTDWGLLNALTLHAKNLPPNGNIKAHAKLGHYFGLGKANPYVR
jgi:hypothetical protein